MLHPVGEGWLYLDRPRLSLHCIKLGSLYLRETTLASECPPDCSLSTIFSRIVFEEGETISKTLTLIIIGIILTPIELLAYGGTFFGPVFIGFAIINHLNEPKED